MKTVAITQRVSVVPAYGERRDCLGSAVARCAPFSSADVALFRQVFAVE